MLIVAIPKSASTSLLATLSNVHGLPAEQLFQLKTSVPRELRLLHKYHSDMRELGDAEIQSLTRPNRIHKQHIPPTVNNLNRLSGVRKVLLLRTPKGVVEAYHRAETKGLHASRKEFESADTLNR